MTMCTMTADTTSSAAPWSSEMNQNARVARAEDAQAGADRRAGAEAVGEPALHGSEGAALRARHGEGRRQDRLAPAELLAQQHRVGAVGVEHERADQELDAEGGGDDPPAVEERAAGHARF